MKSRSVRHRRGGSHGSRRKGFRGGTVCTGVNGGGRRGRGGAGAIWNSATWSQVSGGRRSRRVRRGGRHGGGRDNNMGFNLPLAIHPGQIPFANQIVHPGQMMRGGGIDIRPAICGPSGWNDCE